MPNGVGPMAWNNRLCNLAADCWRIKIALLSCHLESHSRVTGNALYVSRTY